MVDSSENPLGLFVRKLELHVPLSEDDRQAILALPCRIRTLEASSYLVREGDEPTYCAILTSGFAYRQKQTSGGKRQIVSLHIPGEAVDLQHLFLGVADHGVQMLTRGDVATVARVDLQALMYARPAVNKAIVTSILVEASIFREWVLNVGRRDARARMAHLLCEFAIRLEASGQAGGDGYILPISQEQFADALGLTSVHVSRTLKALQDAGLIKRDKRVIAFPSWKKMRDVADFNQRYLHLPPMT